MRATRTSSSSPPPIQPGNTSSRSARFPSQPLAEAPQSRPRATSRFRATRSGWRSRSIPRAPGATPAPTASDAADLILYGLTNATTMNVGNVSEFGFDRLGNFLAYTIDARDQIGNGVQLRDLRTDVTRALDSESALYRRLVWVDSGNAFAVLRGKPDTLAKDTLFTLLAFTGVGTPGQKKVAFDPAGRTDFPAGLT